MHIRALACLALPAIVAAQAPATNLTTRFRTESPAIDQLFKEFKYKDALAKVEALIPATHPEYAKNDPKKALSESTQEFSALMATYSLAGKASLLSGDWAKAKEMFTKARTVAQENHANFLDVTAPISQTWEKAMVDSRKQLDDVAARRKETEAKPEKDRTPQDQELLKAVGVWEGNLVNGAKLIKQLGDHAAGLKKDATAFDKPLEGVDLDLKAESETLAGDKFKGDKGKYVSAVLNTPKNFDLPSQGDKVKLLYRLTFLDPTNARAAKSLQAAIEGKEVPVPEEKKAAATGKKATGTKKK
jgi:hypothetical protein